MGHVITAAGSLTLLEILGVTSFYIGANLMSVQTGDGAGGHIPVDVSAPPP